MPEIAIPTPQIIDRSRIARSRPISQRTALRSILRDATAADHARLDARLGALDLCTMAGYRRFLEINAAAVLPLEQSLLAAGVRELLPDWDDRSRTGALLADLARLRGVPRRLDAPDLPDRFAMLGTLYVLEGSRLGAAYLLRTVRQCGDPVGVPQHGIPWPRRRPSVLAGVPHRSGAPCRRVAGPRRPRRPRPPRLRPVRAGGRAVMKQVDLTNCDREPIHIPGSIQPFGFMIATQSDFTICMASENVADYLGRDSADIFQRPDRIRACRKPPSTPSAAASTTSPAPMRPSGSSAWCCRTAASRSTSRSIFPASISSSRPNHR